MNFDCFNCGQSGHMVAACPHPRPSSVDRFDQPRRDPEVQAAINERGMAKVRAALAGRWDEFDAIVSAEIAARRIG
jgi:hypothetical protein